MQREDNINRKPRRGWPIAIAILGTLAGFCLFVPVSPNLVEQVYADRFYPFIASIIVPVSGAVPFSISLVFIVVMIIALTARYGLLWRNVRTTPAPKRAMAAQAAREIAVIALVGYLAFVVVWGAGYRRPPLAVRLDLRNIEMNEADLRNAIEAMAARIEHDLPDDEARDQDRAFDALRESVLATVTEWDGHAPTLPPRVKRVPFTLLLRLGVLGVNAPYFLEPHVDAGLTDPFFLAVSTHELGHTAGINGESEADFTAWVAGLCADDPYARYALALDCYIDLILHLPPEDQKTALESLPERAYEDLRDGVTSIRRREQRWLVAINRPVYDRYLKSQGIPHGLQDYTQGVTLFLAAERTGLIDLEAYPDDADEK